MSPGLRDPLGLDGSEGPKDPEAMGRALRGQLRRIQPGLALVLDSLGRFRHRTPEGGQQGPAEEDSVHK